MPIDPEEIKIERIKREKQVQDIKNYIEKQHELDKKTATGKMGHHQVKPRSISDKLTQILSKVWSFLRHK